MGSPTSHQVIRGFAAVAKEAGLSGVSPHTSRPHGYFVADAGRSYVRNVPLLLGTSWDVSVTVLGGTAFASRRRYR
jgi:hypothetical protein